MASAKPGEGALLRKAEPPGQKADNLPAPVKETAVQSPSPGVAFGAAGLSLGGERRNKLLSPLCGRGWPAQQAG
ncbi:MAG: hypothetical protein NZ602_14540 [Thermoguttaceae bacterium]|nr:hypothetical protein [Thermoguttaceae bacterium]